MRFKSTTCRGDTTLLADLYSSLVYLIPCSREVSYLVREFRMSYLLSWSIYLWDQLEGVCVEKNAPQEEVSTWIWYQQLFTQRRTFKKKMSPLQIERTRHAKVSAGIYYRQLFAKKENLQYKEMIEISRWSLDRSHPYGLWFIYWDPPKIQTSYIKRTGGNTRLFLIRGELKTALQ